MVWAELKLGKVVD
jgi:hypothetical protein